ncbi:MAG: hypothetical protein NTX59_01470 [Elusimicrobia bacterium]|nr:hypothetical protein [Elusimicrobiota bacterium]
MKHLFRNFKSIFFCLILMGYGAGFAQTNPPQKVNFQGRLTDLANNPLNGSFELVFSLYDAPAGGTALWNETQTGVPAVNGAVEVILGSVTPIPYSVVKSSTIYLGITVDGEALNPRQPFNSVLYSLNTYQLAGKTYDTFVDTSTAQTITGIKTFSANPVFNVDAIGQERISGLTAALAAKAVAATVAVDTTTLKTRIDGIAGDSLGNHIATTTLNMAGFNITNVREINASTITAAGNITAVKYYGDGSGLTNISAGNSLGNHIATTTLNMAGFGINNVRDINVGTITATGNITAVKYYGNGSGLTNLPASDNLGNHIATTTLNMAGFGINNVRDINVSTITAAGNITAAKYYGNGSGLTGITGDSMGNHIATTTLNMAGFNINNVRDINASTITAAGNITAVKYYGDGSGLTNLSASDNLGNHIATTTLNMAGFGIYNVRDINVSTITTTAAGVIFSTNVYITNGNFSIGTISPKALFQVVGASFTVLSTGNVGIGDTNPAEKLTIIGNVRATGDLAIGFGNTPVTLRIGEGAGESTILAPGNQSLTIQATSSYGNAVKVQTYNTAKSAFLDRFVVNGASDTANVYTLNANMGIGTASPGARLDVVGNVKIADGTQGAGKVLTSDANGLATWVAISSFSAGDSYGGGNIFWLDASRNHGLIAATADQSTGIAWSVSGARTTGATLDAVYAGKANTSKIITIEGAGGYAAQVCADYSVIVNNEYYDDWYLPSWGESYLLSQSGIQGLTGYYWSSTEHDSGAAYGVDMSGGKLDMGKLAASYFQVRCIRAF